MGAGSDFSGLLTEIVTTRTPDRSTFPDPLRRRSLEAHRQASRVARQVIDVSCYLHQNPPTDRVHNFRLWTQPGSVSQYGSGWTLTPFLLALALTAFPTLRDENP